MGCHDRPLAAPTDLILILILILMVVLCMEVRAWPLTSCGTDTCAWLSSGGGVKVETRGCGWFWVR